MNLPDTKSFYQFTTVYIVLFTVISWAYVDLRAALSCLFGGVFGVLLFWLMDVAAKGFLKKKSVAIAGSVIVFKYAILGIILYFAMNTEMVHQAGFLIGFLSFIPGSIFWVLKVNKTQR